MLKTPFLALSAQNWINEHFLGKSSSEKTNEPILRKSVNRQVDRGDFVGSSCYTHVQQNQKGINHTQHIYNAV